jgi:DNA modification methylase
MGPIPRPDNAGPPSRRRSPAGEPRKRRALTNVGGKISVEASCRADEVLLTQALDVRADDPYISAHLHGFHSYPARLHPHTAQRLVTGLTRPGQAVLDPFCGSGTVLLEAWLAGRSVFGLDANPLAIALSSLKLHRTSPARGSELLAIAKAVAEAADARRLAKAGAARRHPAGESSQFDPHVFLELDGLQSGIQQVSDRFYQSALMLVLSSILNKVSRRTSDTSLGPSRQRWASGFVIRFFVRKAQELVARLLECDRIAPKPPVPPVCIKLGDAQSLPFRKNSVNAVITSPPYPGIYDYVEHHRLRLKWLGLSAHHLEQHEIGAKRHSTRQDPSAFRSEFNAQLQRCLAEIGRVLVPDGTAVLVLADSVIGRTPWYADEEISRLVRNSGLVLSSQASQVRPHFHEPTGRAFQRRPRCERVLVLRRPGGQR